jgi:hypothetical protein
MKSIRADWRCDVAKWQCTTEAAAKVADEFCYYKPHHIEAFRAAITAAVGAEVDALRKSLAEMLEQARRYDAEVATATARAEQAERERDKACAMYCDLFPVHSAAWHLLTSEQRALVESWRADAERKGNGNV